MRLFFVLGYPNPHPGAAWTRIDFFANAWAKRGYPAEVLGIFSYKSLNRRGHGKSGKVKVSNTIFTLGLSHPGVFIFNTIMALIVSTLYFIIRRPKAVVVSIPTGDIGLGSIIACKLTKTSCLIDYRDDWEDYIISHARSKVTRSFYSALKRMMTGIYSRCSLVTSVTSNLVSKLKSRGLSRVRLVTNGADTRVFKPLKEKTGEFTILFVGGIISYNRLDVALKAIKKLASQGLRNLKFIIVGPGDFQAVSSLAENLGVWYFVECKEPITDKMKLAKVIARADVGLTLHDDDPIWKSALPVKFFEYCACGVPVVATTHADSILAKVITENGVGLTVPPMDEGKLADALYRIYKDKSLRAASGKRARLLAEERFDRNKLAELFLSLVEQSLNQ
jgi:glycosyltransferase involved in cell wall biosynthesis